MKLFNRAKRRAGFTLAETLLAVLILLLVSGIVATGVPVAKNVYDKVVLAANAQVMLTTAVTSLRDELGTAWKLHVVNEDPFYITYYKANLGNLSRLSLSNDFDNIPRIIITDYVTSPDGTPSAKKGVYSLVPDKKSDMYVTYAKVDWGDKNENDAGKVIKISNLKVCRSEGKGKSDPVMTELQELYIRIVSEDMTENTVLLGGE